MQAEQKRMSTVTLVSNKNGDCDMGFDGTAAEILAMLEAAIAWVLLNSQYPAGTTAKEYAENIPGAVMRHVEKMKREGAEQCQQKENLPQ